MQVRVQDLELVDYQIAWDLQNQVAAEIARGERPPTLLLLEHPHTYTLGRQGQAANLLLDEAELARRGIALHWVDRGGDITYHGPGQLVGYPLIPLGKVVSTDGRIPQADYVGYARKLEKTLILALLRLGLVAGQKPGLTGAWVQPEIASRCPRCLPQDRSKPAKIAAIGVKVDAQGISRHGFALNVSPQMEYFDGIIPCGIREYPVVSLADLLLEPPDMQKVKAEIIRAFGEVFECEIML